jgi:type IV pilus biogenesis protein CpaD/CtpE
MRRVLFALAALIVASCARKTGEAVPAAPDYVLASEWYVVDRGGAVDLFYISST